MNNVLLVFLGGGLGSIARYGISIGVKNYFQSNFPVATLCSNILSCILLAVTVALFSERFMTYPSLRMFLIVGICGGFSTFSAFSFETVELFRSGNPFIAIFNILISITVCIGLIYFITRNISQ